ncbi:protein phosphatase methylesterase [Athelia psychrophila]|uniref:Protein phosphatase methylesterase 1 n=1 Tax=Athelia psychrophila TaxID=1759441 RepID=A0A166L6L9_9AGAM|nr:protein phosphatase methylesterase [Fibularhizoctonia sp. CBS 109695]
MSDLYRSAIGARLSKLPHLPPMPTPAPGAGDEDEDEDEDEAGDSIGSLPGSGMGPPAIARVRRSPNATYAPISAAAFFDTAYLSTVPASQLDFRVYYTAPKAKDGAGTVMICHHGAGTSGLSFACFAKEVTDMTDGECGVLALDARRHGKTTPTADASDTDLSIGVLVSDFFGLIQTIFPDPSVAPTLILIGHSMGGSVVTRACPLLLDQKYQVGGVAVLDVVEGSAMEALPHMHSLLNARPDGFDSPEEAVEWHVTTNAIQNPTSARVSVPGTVTPTKNPSPAAPAYEWRTTLRSTAPYWTSWFLGLSVNFLAVRTARLLVLAGTDRLDKELMIGQMQGKFQMVVVPGVGHMLQEDNPTKIAEILVEFWRRNERQIAGIKKVGEL